MPPPYAWYTPTANHVRNPDNAAAQHFCLRAFRGLLEPCALGGACTVLRGRGRSNAFPLPDNCDVSTSAKAVKHEAWHRMRTSIEDRIRDAKHGAGLRHLPSGDRTVNTVWMWAALLAINLSAWLQELGGLDHGNGTGRAHLGTLRHLLLNIPARIVRHARGITLRLPPGQQLLAKVLTRLRKLPGYT